MYSGYLASTTSHTVLFFSNFTDVRVRVRVRVRVNPNPNPNPDHTLKTCMSFGYNPQISFLHFYFAIGTHSIFGHVVWINLILRLYLCN